MSRSAPGRSRVHSARSDTSGATSWRLTPMRSARARIGEGRGGRWRTRSPARRSRRNPCHATATCASGGMTSRPVVVDLARHRRPRTSRARSVQVGGQGRDRQRHPGLDAGLDPPAGRLDVVVDGALGQRHPEHVHAGVAQQPKLRRIRRRGIHADHGRGPQAEARRGERRVHHATADPPPARIPRGDVAAGRAHVHDLDGRSSHHTSRRVYCRTQPNEDRTSRVLLRTPRGRRRGLLRRPGRQRVRVGAPGVLRAGPADPPRRPGVLRRHADRGDRDHPGARPRVRLRQRRAARRGRQRLIGGGRQLPGRPRRRLSGRRRR